MLTRLNKGDGVLTTSNFPFDLDTTSIGLTVSTHIDTATKQSVMDEMLTYKNEDGIIQTYFDKNRPRIGMVMLSSYISEYLSRVPRQTRSSVPTS